MSSYAELKRLLDQEFLADNLDHAATLAFEASWNSNHPLGLFVVARLLRILEDQWAVAESRGQAWMTIEAVRAMEAYLREPMQHYLAALDRDALEPVVELGLLNEIVRALFKWTTERPDPRPGT